MLDIDATDRDSLQTDGQSSRGPLQKPNLSYFSETEAAAFEKIESVSFR